MIVKIPFTGGRVQPIYDTYSGREYFKDVVIQGGFLYADYSGPDSPPAHTGEWPLNEDVEKKWRAMKTGEFYLRMGKAKYGQFSTSTNTDIQYLKVLIDSIGVVDPNNDKIKQLLKACITDGIFTHAQLTTAFEA